MGLCFALNLERVGYHVHGIDSNADYIQALRDKSFSSNEPHVNYVLDAAENLTVSTDIKTIKDSSIELIFICVPTPSNLDGTFDHSYIDEVCDAIIALGRPEKETHLVVNSTVMPGYCDQLHARMQAHGYSVSYNPEFIAQGSIMADQQSPDQVLIGEANTEAGDKIESVYRAFCQGKPRYSRMSRTEAEITKLAVNCFLTTKIAFANSIGDLTIEHGGNQDAVLEAIGADARIGYNFLRYGFGYGGPCLPRDNRAMQKAADRVGLPLPISQATDEANALHRDFQRGVFEQTHEQEESITFTNLAYKRDSDIIEESQRLALAVDLAKKGYRIVLSDKAVVLNQIQAIHKDLFTYEVIDDE